MTPEQQCKCKHAKATHQQPLSLMDVLDGKTICSRCLCKRFVRYYQQEQIQGGLS